MSRNGLVVRADFWCQASNTRPRRQRSPFVRAAQFLGRDGVEGHFAERLYLSQAVRPPKVCAGGAIAQVDIEKLPCHAPSPASCWQSRLQPSGFAIEGSDKCLAVVCSERTQRKLSQETARSLCSPTRGPTHGRRTNGHSRNATPDGGFKVRSWTECHCLIDETLETTAFQPPLLIVEPRRS